MHPKVTPDELLDRLDVNAEPWKPNPGDRVVGVVVSIEKRVSDYGPYPMVTLRTDAGEHVAFHGFHTVAKRELARLRPEAGNRLGIKYLGRSKDDRYESYKLVCDKPAPAVDWDTVAAGVDTELAAGDEWLPPTDDEEVI